MPTPTECYAELEGFGITSKVISPKWVNNYINQTVIPWVEQKTRMTLTAETEKTEVHSGTGSPVLYLKTKNAKQLLNVIFLDVATDISQSFGVEAYQLIAEEGYIRARGAEGQASGSFYFPRGTKNIQVNLLVGYDPADIPQPINRAIILLACTGILNNLASRSGGGTFASSGYSKNFEGKGKFGRYKTDLKRQAISLLRPYMTVGSGS